VGHFLSHIGGVASFQKVKMKENQLKTLNSKKSSEGQTTSTGFARGTASIHG